MSKDRKNVSQKNLLRDTDIVFVLDRSGSMSCVEDATIKGYNDFLKNHQQDEGKVFVTTVLFDDQYEILYERKEIDRVEYMDTKTYYTRGCTALMDAVGKTITTISKKILKGDRVIFVIITDGMENASVEYHKETVKKLIKEHSDWEFVFMGANIDSYAEASSIGIKNENIANFTQNEESMGNLFRCASMYLNEEMEDFCLQEKLDKMS